MKKFVVKYDRPSVVATSGRMNQLIGVWNDFADLGLFAENGLFNRVGGVLTPVYSLGFPQGEVAVKLAAQGRRELATRSTEQQILMVLAVLADHAKWAGDKTINDPGAYLDGMEQRLQNHHEIPGVVLCHAAYMLGEEKQWFPSPKDIIDRCRQSHLEIASGVRFLEASPHDQYTHICNVQAGYSKRWIARCLASEDKLYPQQPRMVPVKAPPDDPDQSDL
jgi:hypothetical protein